MVYKFPTNADFDSWVSSSKPKTVKQYVDWISEYVWILIHKPRHHTAASSSARRTTVTAWRCALHWVKLSNAVYVYVLLAVDVYTI